MPLRDVDETDLTIFFKHQGEPEANRMAAYPPRERDAFMTHWRTNVMANDLAKKKTVVFGGEVAGNVVSCEKNGKRLVGYWIGKAYWGKGVATAAVAEFVCDYETTRPLFAYVANTNVGSIRVLEKCGFRRVGEVSTGPDGVEEVLMQLGGGGTKA
jgi:RimJ/RimL family protein N-acetyltransferase